MAENRFNAGMHRDNSPEEQPEGTTRFALNAVSESRDGEQSFISNEEGNYPCHDFESGWTPLGSVYVGNDETCIFLVNADESLSRIILADKDCSTTVLVETNLGFKLENKIDAVFRLRRGCERIVYFVTPKPMYYNIDRPEKFQNRQGQFSVSKFSLFRRYSSIPIFADITVKEEGSLKAGSYNLAVQYLDQDLNPTEWVNTTETINIYHDSFDRSWHKLRGSTNVKKDYQDFGGATNKSIDVLMSGLDSNFTFYRLAFIEATEGTGQITGVKFSEPLSTLVETFSYTGENFSSEGTVEEIQQFETVIEEAEHITQIENRLLLGNTKGSPVNFCRLQKYASAIGSDLVTKSTLIDNFARGNAKHPTVHVDGLGYVPGELYSFGIVYIFEDNSLSPVYHIPGKRASNSGGGMSSDNKLEATYTDNSVCNLVDYWGKDVDGQNLLGQPIRHHRFPERTGTMFDGEPIGDILQYSRELNVNGNLLSSYTDELITIVLKYTQEGGSFQQTRTISTAFFNNENVSKDLFYDFGVSEGISGFSIFENGVSISNGGTSPNTGLVYTLKTLRTESYNTSSGVFTSQLYRSNRYGITFNNIKKPGIEATGGKEVVGFYIVQNEPTKNNRSVLDSGYFFHTVDSEVGDFIGSGLVHYNPGLTTNPIDSNNFDVIDESKNRSNNYIYTLIHPEFKFYGNKVQDFTRVSVSAKDPMFSGILEWDDSTSIRTQDVAAGTSYDPDVHKGSDSDGFTLHSLSHLSSYSSTGSTAGENGDYTTSNIDGIFYLDALDTKIFDHPVLGIKNIYNISCDNKSAIISFNSSRNFLRVLTGTSSQNTAWNLPYVTIHKDLSNAYSNFRDLPYYQASQNPHLFIDNTEEVSIFNGEVYVCPMRYHTTVYFDTRLADRKEKKSLWKKITGVLTVIVGAILVLSGAGAALGVLLIGSGLSLIAAGIKADKVAKVLQQIYEQGLKKSAEDSVVQDCFVDGGGGIGYPDDELQWTGQFVDFWFEGRVNIGLRKGATIGITDFMDTNIVNSEDIKATGQKIFDYDSDPTSATGVDEANTVHQTYLLEKLTVVDTDKGDGRLFKGIPNAELYEINEDYRRRNIEKIFFHLGLEYDCCSDCVEEFPHRVHYSEQSFQEELSDNYQVFLPNNYRDIEGETGTITDLFRIQNNLYIHTEEGLWHLPQNIQERVTGDVTSFIGTGDFFSIPPRKIVDDSKSSAGTRFKWSSIKTKHGVFFISDEDKKVYQFTGEKLMPISDTGMNSWFRENLKLFSEGYWNLYNNGRSYPYLNSSSTIGVGYDTIYDSKYERIIFSKRDFLPYDGVENTDVEITYYDGDIIQFDNYDSTVASQKALGFSFLGVSEGKMKFYNFNTDTSNNIDGTVISLSSLKEKALGTSWAVSYSLKDQSWTSFHSYHPDFSFSTPERFFTWEEGFNTSWEHNMGLSPNPIYCKFYGRDVSTSPHIIEFVFNGAALEDKIYDFLELHTKAVKYQTVSLGTTGDPKLLDDMTFNKALFYNSKQCSGEIKLVPKSDFEDDPFYIGQQIKNTDEELVIDKNENVWYINGFRDIVNSTNDSLFQTIFPSEIAGYFTDKTVRVSNIDLNKDWTQQESFKDKYLVVRLIFDNFESTETSDVIKLITSYASTLETLSKK